MTKLVYHHKGEWLLEVGEDGSVFARQHGGPVFHMGALWNAEPNSVREWRARIPSSRCPVLGAAFEEARALPPIRVLLPDERSSSLTLGDASIMVVHHALEANAALDRVVAELDGIAAALFASPPTHRSANPERAQAAIDRFYAEGLEPMLAEVAARPRPSAATAVPESEVTSHTFTCEATGGPAGKITLRVAPDGDGRLELTGFSATSDVTIRANPNDVRRIQRQLEDGDVRAFYELDLALAPFFCSDCNRSYSAAHWKIDESPAGVVGTCPSRHRRRMAAR